ncbi:hypothetical protein BDB00DRAFT_793704 [Zychaea mexicana]|uniref:uncharacterized protein n=1 Tax=Zychaea mexicana TaxID=64656 RepID=UPI0022FE5BF6|nr:uncharacterized protein BDB00DRAFT_793704 [Zychaea mexicana]KAI9469141.1 hypothetical protein BDB00DRAFT_793704 [Zychaea mexicana]
MPFGDNSTPLFRSEFFKETQITQLVDPCRQTDLTFLRFLERLRLDELQVPTDYDLLSSRTISLNEVPLGTVMVAPTNDAVKNFNTEKLRRCPGQLQSYRSLDKRDGMGQVAMNALEKTYLPAVLDVKVDAQVMLLENISVENGWVNENIQP